MRAAYMKDVRSVPPARRSLSDKLIDEDDKE